MALFKPTPLKIEYTPGTHVKEFDGWRGISVSGVMLFHFFPTLFGGGWMCMEVFFVLSGFLITGILLDTRAKKGYYKKFIGRRIVRIFPMYYLCLALLFFVLPHSWLDLNYYRHQQAWFWLYGENWLFSIDGWPQTKALHHFWSLAIEEQFYIFWPLFVLVFSPKGLCRVCIFLFFFSIAFRNFGMQFGFVMPFPYVATLGRLEGLLLGALIALLVRTGQSSILEKLAWPVTLASAGLIVCTVLAARSIYFEKPIHYSITYTLLDLLFAGLITLTLAGEALGRFRQVLLWPLLQKAGILSYGLYVFHYPILNIVQNNFLPYFQALRGENQGKLITLSIALAITIIFVYIVHKTIEMPLLKLKKYF